MQSTSSQQGTPAQVTPSQPFAGYGGVGFSLTVAILLPLSLWLVVSGYKKYRIERLRRQIEKLERIWNLTHRR